MKWTIRNFKAIEHASLEINDGSITIITGKNSAGKSSLAQSLLMTAQSSLFEGPVVLNGPLVRLGLPSDLVRQTTSSAPITIEIETSGEYLPWEVQREGAGETTPDEPLKFRFELKADDNGVTFEVNGLEIFSADNDLLFKASQRHVRTVDANLLQGVQNRRRIRQKQTTILKVSTTTAEKKPTRTYLLMHGLQPVVLTKLLQGKDYSELHKRELERALDEVFSQSEDGKQTALGFSAYGLHDHFASLRTNFLRRDSSERETIDKLFNEFDSLRRNARAEHELDKQIVQIKELHSRVMEKLAEFPVLHVETRERSRRMLLGDSTFAETFSEELNALAILRKALSSLAYRIQYLGPLRAEPKVVSQHWNQMETGLPVGAQGELTAAILYREGNRSPIVNAEDGTLIEQVNKWVQRLKLADKVDVQNIGKLGLQLNLDVNGHHRDLTSVGVGVSQVLPLIVGLLSCSHNSIFIVEQPELHLHPGLQAEVADFFLFARPDVTLIIETHSDALITRIRRRLAEGNTLPNRPISIQFVENSESGGAFSYDLGLNELGDLDRWPEGFLGTDSSDSVAILKAQLSRATQSEQE